MKRMLLDNDHAVYKLMSSVVFGWYQNKVDPIEVPNPDTGW